MSRHAQSQMAAANITQTEFEDVLLKPIRADTLDGQKVVWREKKGIRIVILLYPEPKSGAVLVKTVFKIAQQAKVR